MENKKDKISFVYFDIGGVVIKDLTNSNEWQQIFRDLGVSPEILEEVSKSFLKFEKEASVGRSVEDFIPILRKEFGIKVVNNYSLLADFVNRFSRNIPMEKLLNGIKNKCSLGLLTNMYPGELEAIKREGLLPKVEWKLIIDSSVVKYKKPEIEIYKLAEKMVETKAKEILFIDNKEKNLENPRKMGWKTFWFDSNNYEKSNKELGLFLANKVEF